MRAKPGHLSHSMPNLKQTERGGEDMRAFLMIFVVLFVVTVLWRTVFVKKKDRKAIRFGIKELAIALTVSTLGAAGLFFALFNNTMRIV